MVVNNFSFNCVSKLIIKSITVNEPKRSSFIKSTDWLKYKNATVNMNNVDDRCFQYASMLTQYNWNGEKYPTVTNDNKCIIGKKIYGNCFNCTIF